MLRSCVICGVEFKAKDSRHVACSKLCGAEAANERKRAARHSVLKLCKICGGAFQARGNRRVTCSKQCRVENTKVCTRASRARASVAKATKPTRACVICGGTFRAKTNRHITCSRRCSVKNARLRARKYPAGYRILKCVICGGESQVNASSRALVCSEQCSTERKRIWQLEYRAANYSAIREKKIRRYAENRDAEGIATANVTPRDQSPNVSATAIATANVASRISTPAALANSNIAPKTPKSFASKGVNSTPDTQCRARVRAQGSRQEPRGISRVRP